LKVVERTRGRRSRDQGLTSGKKCEERRRRKLKQRWEGEDEGRINQTLLLRKWHLLLVAPSGLIKNRGGRREWKARIVTLIRPAPGEHL